MNTDSESDIEDTEQMNHKYRNLKMPFGKYKGQKLLAIIEDNKPEGQTYFKWLLKNIPIKNTLLQEALEFYSDYQ